MALLTGKRSVKVIALLLSAILIIGVMPITAFAATGDVVPADTKVGDTITFGSYEQDNNTANGKEAVEWQVLEVKDGKALVISKYALDAKPYNPERVAVTWEECNIRKWLNNDFLSTAFTADEQKHIASAELTNADNPSYGTKGGNTTTDKVFLLSIDEAQTYLPTNEALTVSPTAYAFACGAWTSEAQYSSGASCGWWLRSPGYISFSGACVTIRGAIYFQGDDVYSGNYGVRPVIWLSNTENSDAPVAPPAVVEDPASEEVLAGADTKVGDIITFGAYEQDNNAANGKEAIEWQVLEVDGGKALVTSKYALDCKPYNIDSTPVSWEGSTLRAWLNNEFFNAAFSAGEQKSISATKIANDDNPFYYTDGGNDTTDRVFLLSTAEVDQYFPVVAERAAYPTEYAFAQGAWTYDKATGQAYWMGFEDEASHEYHSGASCWRWLRSPGYISIFAMFCRNDGQVTKGGELVDVGFITVCPVMWINLESEEPAVVEKPEIKEAPITAYTKVGDIITFGAYEQDNDTTNGAEPIEWEVIESGEGKALVISKYALDCKPYNDKYAAVTWENCTLRTWLNNEFFASAFSADDQKLIVPATIANEPNPFYGTDGGNSTTDKVFLLSTDEADKYFPVLADRIICPTAYAFEQGVWTYNIATDESFWTGYSGEEFHKYDSNASCWWWLRSPGYISIFAMFCRNDGHVLKGGEINSTGFAAVRPVMWISQPAKPVVVASSQALTVDGAAKTAETYNIDGNNYYKLRDLAALLNGTAAQFSVNYDEATKSIRIVRGEAYDALGTELAVGTDNSASCVISSQSLYIGGTLQDMSTFNIGGSNFFKLREIGGALGFGVEFDEATNTVMITTGATA